MVRRQWYSTRNVDINFDDIAKLLELLLDKNESNHLFVSSLQMEDGDSNNEIVTKESELIYHHIRISQIQQYVAQPKCFHLTNFYLVQYYQLQCQYQYCQTNSCLYQSLLTHLSIYRLHTLSTYTMYSLLYNLLLFTCTSLIILHKTYLNIHDNTFVSTLIPIFTRQPNIILPDYDS